MIPTLTRESIPAYILSTVVIRWESAPAVELPSIVGRTAAACIAESMRSDFPGATVTVVDCAKDSLVGIQEALTASDSLLDLHLQVSVAPRPGERLLMRLGLSGREGDQ